MSPTSALLHSDPAPRTRRTQPAPGWDADPPLSVDADSLSGIDTELAPGVGIEPAPILGAAPPPGSAGLAVGDGLALAMWQQLRSRSAADRRVVFLALAGRLASGVHAGTTARGERAELALRSLHLCAHATGRVPSRRSYDAWHAAQPDRREWASATAIRNSFGSWTRALAACGFEPSPDVRGRSLAAFGQPFSERELVAALRAWDAETAAEDRSFAAYRRFVKRVRGDWAVDGRRLPGGLSAFHRVFGSWGAALTAAGVSVPGDARRRGVRYRGSRSEYTHERICDWLRAAAQALGVRRVGMEAYDAWAKDRCLEALGAGSVVSIARSNTICVRFGSWGAALVAAGLISADEAGRVGPNGVRVRETDMLAALQRAIREAGRDEGRVLTMTEYAMWRAAQPDQDGRMSGQPIPHPGAIRTHFGRWHHAVCAALDGDPELARTFKTRPVKWVTRWETR